MGSLAVELITFSHAVPALSNRVRTAVFDGTSHQEQGCQVMRDGCRGAGGMNERKEMKMWRLCWTMFLYVCVCVCARGKSDGVEVKGWLRGAISPTAGNRGQEGAVACGYTAKHTSLSLLPSTTHLLIGVWLWKFCHRLWCVSVIHCVITHAMMLHHTRDGNRGGSGKPKILPAVWEDWRTSLLLSH